MREPPRRPTSRQCWRPYCGSWWLPSSPSSTRTAISMWGYVVLLALDRSSMRTQAALAEAINADKTRIIRTLDELQERGHIERRPDPDDRRVRLLAITDAGRAVKDAVQADVQRGEERWLGELRADERRMFLRVLQRLTPEEAG